MDVHETPFLAARRYDAYSRTAWLSPLSQASAVQAALRRIEDIIIAREHGGEPADKKSFQTLYRDQLVGTMWVKAR
jgi:hypothetical protein